MRRRARLGLQLMTVRRSPIFGPEPWMRVGSADCSHWDLWFCLLCVTDFGGDWRALEGAIVDQERDLWRGRDWEVKDSHLHDLQRRLAAAGIDAHHVVACVKDLRPFLARARRKVLAQSLGSRDITPAMRDTPRRRLQARALRGHWASFPISPQTDCDVFADLIEDERSGRRSSFGIAMTLEKAVLEMDRERAKAPAARLALWRALVTAGMEAFGAGLRDPDGAVATAVGNALAAYAALPWEATWMTREDRHADLCELCVWDEWGLLHKRDTAPFRTMSRGDAAEVEEILLRLADEHRAVHLSHQADNALQLAAWLCVATRSFDRFVVAAHRLGSNWWMPVTAMADAAVEAGRAALAVEVLEAATARSGTHRELLLGKLAQMTATPSFARSHRARASPPRASSTPTSGATSAAIRAP
jgi:hypothetical protein